ncbi:MAG: type I restriction-modification system subunit M [Paludibacteraceae bacterium]|nr:type I restriction-modification system subunit M [Paludibacteraceae bacterium]
MTKQEKEQLFRALWSVADVLRGAMTADNFRDYMLSLLFYRYISARYESTVCTEMGGDLPEDMSLLEWYKENEADVQEFEKMMLQSTHYIIKPEYLWSAICELARTQDDNLLSELGRGFRHIEEESFKGTFKGLFSEINLDSEKLGKDYAARNKMMCNIISTLEKQLAEFDQKGDILGDAYEYLIGQFAAGGGKKAGEFYTPQQASTILSRIVTLDCQDPATGNKRELRNVLDFACGSGSLLLNVNNQMRLNGGKIGKIYGQEKEMTTFNLARMNMLLHGLHDSEFEIFHGDTLTNDWGMLKDSNPVKPVTFDAVVANPPFSLKWEPDDETSNDPRFKNYGVAPKSAADFAFLLHGFNYLSDSGTMAIILPHGVLFRGGAEATIRKKLICDDNIDCVIGLPSNLFYSTGIPVCIIVLKKCRKSDDVLFINAAECFEKGKKQNQLLPEHIDKIIETYRIRSEEDRFSRRVKLKEIAENDYNLNITRYVSLAQEEAQIDLKANHKLLIEIESDIAEAKKKLNIYLKELGLNEI